MAQSPARDPIEDQMMYSGRRFEVIWQEYPDNVPEILTLIAVPERVYLEIFKITLSTIPADSIGPTRVGFMTCRVGTFLVSRIADNRKPGRDYSDVYEMWVLSCMAAGYKDVTPVPRYESSPGGFDANIWYMLPFDLREDIRVALAKKEVR